MIEIRDLSVHVGNFRLDSVTFIVPAGEYCVLMGKTGCGKSTILETICGLRAIQKGSIHLMNQDVTRMKPAQRGIGYVPQDGALFYNLTIFDHLAFALRIRNWKQKEIGHRVEELSHILGIHHLLSRKPAGLSGGEIQRVSLGRALSFHPDILLLDEPMSALDEDTKIELYDLIRSIRNQYAFTALHVTHNWSEARSLADQILVLQDGRVIEKSILENRMNPDNQFDTKAYLTNNIGSSKLLFNGDKE